MPLITNLQTSNFFCFVPELYILMSFYWYCPTILSCHPLLPPSIFSSIKVFSNESALHIRWPKYWSFSFSFSPSGEYSGLISFRIDCFDFLSVQGTIKLFLKHHCSKGASGKKKPNCQCRRHKFHPWVRKIPWRREWQPTPVFLAGESPRTEEPGGLQSMRSQVWDTT